MDEEWIVNRYQLQEPIGQGAMGTVYRAVDARLGEVTVAIKFLAQTLQSVEMCDRFEQEAKISAQLSSTTPYIVPVTDYGVDHSKRPFYVMQYLEGQNLQGRMHPHLSLPDFLNVSQQICLGLQCAHEGIQLRRNEPRLPVIHCDLKPSNIFVISEPMLGETVRILDFGIATLFTTNSQEQGFQGGTPPYCSPEQLRGEVLDPRSDLYSLGILMFEMLTGRLPFSASKIADWKKAHCFHAPPSLAQVAPNRPFPQTLATLIQRCLAKKPGDRPQSAQEIFEILRDIGAQFNVQLPPDPLVKPATPKSVVPNSPVVFPQRQRRSASFLSWQGSVQAGRIQAQQLFSGPESLTSFWCMLPHSRIQTIQIHQAVESGNKIEVHRLFLGRPHPMLLWVTMIYTLNRGFVWIPCFLDLKHPRTLHLAHLLAQKGFYQVLLFDFEPPHSCSCSLYLELSNKQQQELGLRLMESRILPSGSPAEGKKLLMEKYQELKQRIEQKYNQ